MQLLRGNPDFDLFFIYDEVYCNRKEDGVIPTIMAAGFLWSTRWNLCVLLELWTFGDNYCG